MRRWLSALLAGGALLAVGCVVPGGAAADGGAPDMACMRACTVGITGEMICIECPPPSLGGQR